MEVWLSVAEVARLSGVTDRTVRDRLAKGRFRYDVSSGRGGVSGKQYRIALSSLDLESRVRWYAAHPEVEMPPEVAAIAGLRQQQCKVPVSEAALELVKVMDKHGEGELAKAVQRMDIVKEALRLEGRERREYIERVAREQGVSAGTIYRWMKEYREGGLLALVDETKRREGAGYGSRAVGCQQAIDFIHGLFLQPHKPKGSMVYRWYVDAAKAKHWPICSKATFYRILKDIAPTYVVYGREGERKWEQTMMPKAKRTREGILRNEWWIFDHHQLDFWCEYNGRPIRPWITAIEDYASTCIVGFAFCVKPSSDSIAAAVASAVFPKAGLPFVGMPAHAYMDNGKDYRSYRISGKVDRFKAPDYGPAVRGLFDLMNVEVTNCLPYAPYAKPVERIFRIVTEFSREQVSYCGSNPETCPEHVTASWVKRQCAEGKLPRFEDLPAMFVEWYKRTYLNLPSSAVGGKTPIQAYSDLVPCRSDMPDPNVSFLLFGKGDTAKVGNQGICKFGREYWFWSDELYRWIGREVTVRYDPARIGELYVFAGARFICKAENRELLRMGASEEALKRWCKERAGIRRRIREEVTTKRKTAVDVVEEVKAAGPSIVTVPLVGGQASRVKTLTGFEKAAKARGSSRPEDGQGPAAERKRDLADEYLMHLADRALARAK